MENHIFYLIVGTYTSGKSEGIYLFRFDLLSAETEFISMAAVENPSYLTCSHDYKYIFAVTENEGKPSYANAFSFDRRKGELVFINRQPTHGDAPCFIATDPEGKSVVTANYGGGSITVFPVERNGALEPPAQVIRFTGHGTDPVRQEKPHIHCIGFTPDHLDLLATDLGTDHLYKFTWDSTSPKGSINEVSRSDYGITAGSGPRHFIFHPSGKFLYLINELSGTVMVFSYNNRNLTLIQELETHIINGKGGGDIVITPDGKWLYASNRLKNDGVAVFSVCADTGRLTRLDYQSTGIHPRNIAVSPNGRYLLVANKDSHLIEIFHIDPKSGLLHDTGKTIKLDQPVCLIFAPLQN